MDRTLFNAAMIETFRVCRRAYQLAFGAEAEGTPAKSTAILKKFLLKGIHEINKGRITNLNQIQKFMGMHWPSENFPGEEAGKAFLFAYKTLSFYLDHPYKPKGARVVAINLKVRSRIVNLKVYLEDSFDMILWHPAEKRLELVDFHLYPLKPFDPAWPSAFILVKQFLSEKLGSRWPFEKISLTLCRVSANDITPMTFHLDESVYRVHWPELVKTIEEMKNPDHHDPHQNKFCNRCQFLSKCNEMGGLNPVSVSQTA